jgi:hypothetical protein
LSKHHLLRGTTAYVISANIKPQQSDLAICNYCCVLSPVQIVDTDGGIATTYDGNYSRFLKLKKSRLEAMEAAYSAQQKKITAEKAWINKFKNKGSFGSQVQMK